MIVRLVAIAISIGLMGHAPVSAQNAPAPNTNAGDPNERICENITMTGSRLAVKRFCGTRAQWADKQLQDRQEVERIQRSPCVY